MTSPPRSVVRGRRIVAVLVMLAALTGLIVTGWVVLVASVGLWTQVAG